MANPDPWADPDNLVPALFHSRCSDCGEDIEPGDPIGTSVGGYWACETCFAWEK